MKWVNKPCEYGCDCGECYSRSPDQADSHHCERDVCGKGDDNDNPECRGLDDLRKHRPGNREHIDRIKAGMDADVEAVHSRWERFTAWVYYWGYWFWRLGG